MSIYMRRENAVTLTHLEAQQAAELAEKAAELHRLMHEYGWAPLTLDDGARPGETVNVSAGLVALADYMTAHVTELHNLISEASR